MSTYIGKDSSSSNVIHFTSDERTVTEMQSGILSSTYFHSSRPYLVIEDVYEYVPNYNSLQNITGDAASFAESLEYVVNGSSPILTSTTAYILAFEFYVENADNTGGAKVWHIASGGSEWIDPFKPTSLIGVHFLVNKVTSTTILTSVSFPDGYPLGGYDDNDNLTAAPEDNYEASSAPLRIHMWKLKNEISNHSAPELDGELVISHNDGVSVGTTQFFEDRYLVYGPTVDTNLDTDYVYKVMTDEGNTYVYAMITSVVTPPYDISIDTGTILTNGKSLISSSHNYVGKLSVKHIDITESYPAINTTDVSVVGDQNLYLSATNAAIGLSLNGLTVDTTSTIMFNLSVRFSSSSEDEILLTGVCSYLDEPTTQDAKGLYRNGSSSYDPTGAFSYAFSKVKDTGGDNDSNLVIGDYVLSFDSVCIFNHSDGSWNRITLGKKGIPKITGWIIAIDNPFADVSSVPLADDCPDTASPKGYTITANTGHDDYAVYQDTSHVTLLSAANDTYNWADLGSGVYESTNQSDGNSYCILQISASLPINVHVNVSAEQEYDFVLIRDQSDTFVDDFGDQGGTAGAKGNVAMSIGDTYTFVFKKDSSTHEDDDKATLKITKT